MSEITLQERCTVAAACLPEAPYRTMLMALHGEMTSRITELEAQLAAVRKPITPDMVTDEMVNMYLHTPTTWLANRHKNTITVAYNIVNAAIAGEAT